jgi:hypothetical protein
MSDAPGFTYEVSDEQLRAFAARPPAERLRWLEEMREATWKLATPAVRASWARLRRGDR